MAMDRPTWGYPGDYHLQSSSPAIDSGTAVDAPDTDLDYNSKPAGNGADMGAYECWGAGMSAKIPYLQASIFRNRQQIPVVHYGGIIYGSIMPTYYFQHF